MIYLSNFFARKIEAISRQIEEVRTNKKDPIISCCYFLEQRPLSLNDIKDNIWVFPRWLYPFVAFLIVVFSRSDIHLFEDELSFWRLFACNLKKRNIYISLFKGINANLIGYLNKVKYIKAIIVEDEISRKVVINHLKSRKIRVFLKHPPSLWKSKNMQLFYGQRLLFASWNGGDVKSLKERGIYDLLRLVKDTLCTCVIILRDRQTTEISRIIKKLRIEHRIKLILPKNFRQLRQEFEKTNYVVVIPRKPVMKHVPNSIIDGLSLGKPCIISGCLRFSKTVRKQKIGLFFDYRKIGSFEFPSKSRFKSMSINCLRWAKENIFYSYSSYMKDVYIHE